MATTLQQARTSVRTASGLDMLAGLWLIVSPFLLGFSGVTAAAWNMIVVGAIVTLLAASREFGEGYRQAWPSWTNSVIGAWLVLSPFTLGYAAVAPAFWNSIIMGIAVIVLSSWSAMSTPQEAVSSESM